MDRIDAELFQQQQNQLAQQQLNQEPHVVTHSGLKVLHTFSELLKAQKEGESPNVQQQLVIQEKLIYCGLHCMEEGKMKDLTFDLMTEITDFVERANAASMSKMQTNLYGPETQLISKAVDILFNKLIVTIFKQYQPLNRLRVLTFSNLSYIYREQNKYQDALKSVNYAISLEERLADENYQNCAKNIITSYLNKSAILSELGRHDRALQSVEKALQSIQRFESQAKSESQKSQINYLYMVAYYNFANESEVLGLRNQCLDCYEQAAIYAKKVNNLQMINKINEILENIVAKQAAKKKKNI